MGKRGASWKPVKERFWPKVQRGTVGDCWPWLASCKSNGYGQFYFGPNDVRPAHRVAYELAVGPIPDGADLDHLCRNRACVNPAHLEPVTRRENAARGNKGALTTHCPQGHPYDDTNTRWTKSGWRSCRACNRERARARYVPRRKRLLTIAQIQEVRATPRHLGSGVELARRFGVAESLISEVRSGKRYADVV